MDTRSEAARAITQSVAVEANKKYVFETFYKSELKTTTTVKWEIVDAADGKVLAATEPIASAVNSAPATRLIIIGGFLPIAGGS